MKPPRVYWADREELVAGLRTTAIMKTDLGGSTPHFRGLGESDLSALLASHRQLVADVAAAHGGQVVKPEGDAFWLVFPSVSAACQAALAIQEALRLTQLNRGDDRLAMRIVITLGDVQREDEALVGDAVVLAARIEALTPPDEIYLSQAARLAVKPAEVATSLVDTFPLKGFPEPVPVYRVDASHRTRIFEDQYIVLTDLGNFGVLMNSGDVAATEKVLDALLEAVEGACREHEGTSRFSAGDAHCLTFTDPERMMTAVDELAAGWSEFRTREEVPCPLNVAVHKGAINVYRAYVYGNDLNVVGTVERTAPEKGVYLTGAVHDDLANTAWAKRLEPIETPRLPSALEGTRVYRLGP